MEEPTEEDRQQWLRWSTTAGEAMAAGHAPSSPAGRALAHEVAEAMGLPPAEAADQIAVGHGRPGGAVLAADGDDQRLAAVAEPGAEGGVRQSLVAALRALGLTEAWLSGAQG